MSPNTGVLQVLQDGRSLFATAISPPLLFCTPSHLLMAQAIITRAGTRSALVPGQLPAPAREVESLLNVPRSPVDRSKRPRCSTKQRTQSQTSSQPQAPPPELLQGSPGPAATGATSPWHLQGTPGLLCPLPSLPQPQAAGPRHARLGQLLPLTNTKISSGEPCERVSVSACSGSNTQGQSSNIRAQMMTGKQGRNNERTI